MLAVLRHPAGTNTRVPERARTVRTDQREEFDMTDHITVIGNIASVPERRELPGGGIAVGFRLASTQRRLDGGQWVDVHTNWYSVSAYRKLAEHALSSLEKGQRVIVTGRFRVKQWESGGKSGSAAEIDADGLGPDLMFGTTTFHRSAAPAEAGPAPATDAWATATPVESGGPGVAASTALNEPSATPSEVPAPSAAPDGQQERELVPAGAWTPPMEDTTPF